MSALFAIFLLAVIAFLAGLHMLKRSHTFLPGTVCIICALALALILITEGLSSLRQGYSRLANAHATRLAQALNP